MNEKKSSLSPIPPPYSLDSCVVSWNLGLLDSYNSKEILLNQVNLDSNLLHVNQADMEVE